MDSVYRRTLHSMLGYVDLWRDDVRAGLMPTRESIAAARLELLNVLGRPAPRTEGKSDVDEYREVYALQQRNEARAMKEGR